MRAIWKGLVAIHSAIVLILGAQSALLAQQAANQKMGTLELMVSDTYGKPIKSFEIEIMSNDDVKNVRRVAQAGPIAIPYGTYTIRGRASLHEPFERRVTLQQPHLLVLVAFAFVHYGESSLRQTPLLGHVENLPTSAGLNWVRVVSVFGEFTREVVVDPQGRFELSEMPYGDYFLLVFHDVQTLRIQRFSKTVQNTELAVDLAAPAPGVR